MQAEVNEVMLSTETEGVVIKAESLGSLEALARLLNEKGIKVKESVCGKSNQERHCRRKL